jgi:ADP-heptose:LPS heptosyltransferase
MGPTDPAWTGRSPAAVVQNTALDCLGCHRTRCPIDHPCMEALDPALVVTAARERLAAARRDPPFAG